MAKSKKTKKTQSSTGLSGVAKSFTKKGFYKRMCKKHGVDPKQGNKYIDTDGVLTDLGKKQYKRCTFRKGKRDEVFKKSTAANGICTDPNVASIVLVKTKFAMGHKPGYEHEKHQIASAVQEKARDKFNDEYNDTSHYQAEDPVTNSGHKYEDSTMDYFGS